jgi:hypothetical protein
MYFPLALSDLDITLEFEDGPNAPQSCADQAGFVCDAAHEVLFPLDVWQHLSRIPWRRLQLRFPPDSGLSFGPLKPTGHLSIIGKVLPMMRISAREEACMELIIRLIDLDTRPASSDSSTTVALEQVTIHSGSIADMNPLYEGLGLGDRRIAASRGDEPHKQLEPVAAEILQEGDDSNGNQAATIQKEACDE